MPEIVGDFPSQDISSQLSEVRPWRGNQCRYVPPAKKTIKKTANRNTGIADPTITANEVHMSKEEPSVTAFLFPAEWQSDR